MTKPKPVNRLQAVLDAQAAQQEPVQDAPPAPVEGQGRDRAPGGRSAAYRPSRDGKRFIGGYFDPKVQTQLKIIAAEDDTTVQELVEEALDLLFVKKGRGQIIRR